MSADYRKAFLDAIAADRYDVVARRAYADWLDENGFDDEAAEQRKWTPARQEAEDWLRNLAEQMGLTYEDVIQAGHDWFRDEQHFIQEGTERARYVMSESNNIELFWRHWQTITEVEAPTDRQGQPFSCTC